MILRPFKLTSLEFSDGYFACEIPLYTIYINFQYNIKQLGKDRNGLQRSLLSSFTMKKTLKRLLHIFVIVAST